MKCYILDFQDVPEKLKASQFEFSSLCLKENPPGYYKGDFLRAI